MPAFAGRSNSATTWPTGRSPGWPGRWPAPVLALPSSTPSPPPAPKSSTSGCTSWNPARRLPCWTPPGAPVPYQEVARRPQKIQWDPQRADFYCSGRVYPPTVVSPPPDGPPAARWQRWLGEEVEILFPAALPPAATRPSASSPLSSEERAIGIGRITHPQPPTPNPRHQRLVRTGWRMIRCGSKWPPTGPVYLWDKTSGRQYGPLNSFRSEADRGDEYSFCPAEADQPVSSRDGRARIALVEDGPLRATLEIRLVLEVPAGLAVDRRCRVAETVTLPICTRLSLKSGPAAGRDPH